MGSTATRTYKQTNNTDALMEWGADSFFMKAHNLSWNFIKNDQITVIGHSETK